MKIRQNPQRYRNWAINRCPHRFHTVTMQICVWKSYEFDGNEFLTNRAVKVLIHMFNRIPVTVNFSIRFTFGMILAPDIVARNRLEYYHTAFDSLLLLDSCRRRYFFDTDCNDAIPFEIRAFVFLIPDFRDTVTCPRFKIETYAFQLAILTFPIGPFKIEFVSDFGKRFADKCDKCHHITPVALATFSATSGVMPLSPSMVNLSDLISCACERA